MQLILSEPTTGVSVDLKKRRIRVSRKIFQQLDMPEYFRILVNPNSKGMVIEGCLETAKGSYQLSKVPSHKSSYELTSTSLVGELVQCAGFSGVSLVKLTGYPIEGQAALFFRMEQQPTEREA